MTSIDKTKINTNIKWNDVFVLPDTFVKKDDNKYKIIENDVINSVFPSLNQKDKDLLVTGLVQVINLIYIKFNFIDNGDALWRQLTQNNYLDLQALLLILLPFIDDKQNDKKQKLKSLEQLYLEKDSKGKYMYTNSQYNRCIRRMPNDQIIFRPYIHDYFLQHLELLMMSIIASSNKLYVNWIDVLPMRMNNFKKSKLYAITKQKIATGTIKLVNGYLDATPGISISDWYDTIVNHLYHQIKNHKWLIYDILDSGKPVNYITFLEKKINLESIWNNKLWSQLDQKQRSTFDTQWKTFLNSTDPLDNEVMLNIYFFFAKYHKSAERLIKLGKLKLAIDNLEEIDAEDIKLTKELTKNAVIGLEKVPSEEIYSFFEYQLSEFKKSWYYYFIVIKKEKFITSNENINITPKNIYNYAKSLSSFTDQQNNFLPMPRHWLSLPPDFRDLALIRIFNIPDKDRNNWEEPTNNRNWFNINNYIKKFYSNTNELFLLQTNKKIHDLIYENIQDIIFESLIYHGLLSEFVPAPEITDNNIAAKGAGSNDENIIKAYKRTIMKKMYFSGEIEDSYKTEAYYFLTSAPYGNLDEYFKFMTSDRQLWSFTYAMNWVSQINFYHHYVHDSVIYVTGATGVGKSTQVPKLLLYSQKMLDFNDKGRIVCTQPRRDPTESNAKTISREMGVPIEAENKLYGKSLPTANYYIQFKHKQDQHVNNQIDSFLRIVTDGTLLEEMKQSPFLTRTQNDTNAADNNGNKIDWNKKYLSGNVYDIVIVDEAHEHNANMDIILTLARDAISLNNSLKLVIVSATMDDDEPIYRRYYRNINDNRAYPLNAYIEQNELDRANMDRRIHISAPGQTTQYKIVEHYLSPQESAQINVKNYYQYAIDKTVQVANTTQSGDILLFLTGKKEIDEATKEINKRTIPSVICFGFYSDLDEDMRNFITNIDKTLPNYTRVKEDVLKNPDQVTRSVPKGTYKRAIIIATNVAEASITIKSLRYVIDIGYAKVDIFDPIDQIQKLKTLEISKSSSEQRKGRVGRVAPGEVYYLYSEEKIQNNKTMYKIATSNITDLIVDLIKMEPNDTSIINNINDINHIDNLDEINTHKNKDIYEEQFPYITLDNPRNYLDIIAKQYLYVPVLGNPNYYYTYYGKIGKNKEPIDRLYFENNHDDYHYQKEYLEFFSRCQTGYDDFVLQDGTLTFYIIHPDENIIERNPYTGKMMGLKYSDAIPMDYYSYVLAINNFKLGNFNDFVSREKNYDYSKFILPKYSLAIDEATLQTKVISVTVPKSSYEIRYTDLKGTDVQGYVKKFYDLISQNYPETTTIRSQFYSHIKKISGFFPENISSDYYSTIWYSYAIPMGVDKDVLALITFINKIPDLKNATYDPIKFMTLNKNNQGDIYAFWKIWNGIKKVMEKNSLFELAQFDKSYLDNFKRLKNNYLGSTNNQTINIDQYKLFDNLYYSGKLGTIDDFYYYANKVDPEFIDSQALAGKTAASKISDVSKIISGMYYLNEKIIQDFLSDYLNNLFQINKSIWLEEYDSEFHISGKENEKNTIEWLNKHLRFPSFLKSPHPEENINHQWNLILESYIRAYSSNLVFYDKDSYLKISRGVRINPTYFDKKETVETTLLTEKSRYMIYHHIHQIKDDTTIMFLTPIKIEWVFSANPIYYYYLLHGPDTPLKRMDRKENENAEEAYQLLEKNKQYFSNNTLIAYLDRFNNPNFSKIIRESLLKN